MKIKPIKVKGIVYKKSIGSFVRDGETYYRLEGVENLENGKKRFVYPSISEANLKRKQEEYKTGKVIPKPQVKDKVIEDMEQELKALKQREKQKAMELKELRLKNEADSKSNGKRSKFINVEGKIGYISPFVIYENETDEQTEQRFKQQDELDRDATRLKTVKFPSDKVMINFNFRIMFNKTKKKNVGTKEKPVFFGEKRILEIKDHLVSDTIDLKTFFGNDHFAKERKSVYDVVDNLTHKYIKENYYYISAYSYISSNIKYATFKNVKLENTKMKGTKLSYKLLGDLKNVNKNDGQCVLDYILYECSRTRHFKKVNRRSLILFFGSKCVDEGISSKQIIEWAKHMGNVSVHALNPMFNQFSSYTATKAEMSLCFIVNNDHCYPIMDTAMKKQIAEQKGLELKKVVFNVDFRDYDYIDTNKFTDDEAFRNNILEGKYKLSKKILLFNVSDLLGFVQLIGKQCNQIVYNMKFNKSRVTMFEHPTSKQIFVASENFLDRKHVMDDIKAELNIAEFEFTNQSWTQIGTNYMKYKYGDFPKSNYSNDLMDILQNYKLAPYIAQVNKKPVDESLMDSYDICRCYTSILIDNDVDYNVFSVFDNVQPFNVNDTMSAGEYFVSKNILMARNTIKLSEGWYPLVFVKYCLDNNYITREDITYKIIASTSLMCDAFKLFAEDTFNNWKDHSKMIINSFIGELNTSKRTESRGCVTDSLDIAMGTFLSEEVKGEKPSVYNVNGLYFLRSDKVTKLTSGYIPIWRHVISSGYIKLDKLFKAVASEDSKVIAYNTDSIKLTNPKNVEIKQVPTAGDIRIEEKAIIRGRYIAELEDNEPYTYTKREWKILQETKDNYEDIIDFVKNNSCMVNGMGGVGKTEVIKRTMTKDDICFTFTHKACDNLRKRGVSNVHVFDVYFVQEVLSGKPPKSCDEFKSIFVDEIMCVPSQWIKKLIELKRNTPHLQFKLFGDSRQTEPIETMLKPINYDTNPTIMDICNFNKVEMIYKFTRYDKSLYDVIMYFDENNKLPETCADKKEKECFVNLCYTNKTRQRINEETFKRYVKTYKKQVINIKGVDVCEGMPLIALKNRPKLGIYNSKLFNIVEITDSEVILSDDVKVSKRDFTMKGKNSTFDYAFCMTTHKFQGSEIQEDYCIYEIARMDKKLLNTALTRGKSLDKVHFNYTKKIFKQRIYSEEPFKIITKEPDLKDGRIYAITNKNNQAYVGSTNKSIEERYTEHKEESVNKKMCTFMKTETTIKLVQEFKYIDKKTILKLEDTAIKNYAEKYEMMNVKININEGEDKQKEQVVIEQVSYWEKKFKITTSEKEQAYIIDTIIEGQRIKHKTRWGKRTTKEDARLIIEQKQMELIKQFS
jgi:hypothetical protein